MNRWPRMYRTHLLAGLMPLVAVAQEARTGRLDGVVFDSLHARGLDSALVLATRTSPSGQTHTVLANDAGRFRFDSLPAGHYLVTFSHPLLDSLDLFAPTRDLEVTAGARSAVAFGIPSGTSIRALTCPGVSLPNGTGALRGRVTDAVSERAISGAQVVIQWNVLTAGQKDSITDAQVRTSFVKTDTLGGFLFCGVPTERWISIQAQTTRDTGTVINVSVPNDAGRAVLELSVEAHQQLRSSTASLTGMITGPSGEAVAGAQLRVAETGVVGRSDARGRYSLSGLPGGTQVLEVRKLGFREVEQPVVLRPLKSVEQDVRLSKVVSLDSVRIVAQQLRYPEFEANRKKYFLGQFLDESDVTRRTVGAHTSDVMATLAGVTVRGRVPDVRISMNRAPPGCREANVVIDGVQKRSIDEVSPQRIAAIEVYRSADAAPGEYQSYCGLIVIHTKR